MILVAYELREYSFLYCCYFWNIIRFLNLHRGRFFFAFLCYFSININTSGFIFPQTQKYELCSGCWKEGNTKQYKLFGAHGSYYISNYFIPAKHLMMVRGLNHLAKV